MPGAAVDPSRRRDIVSTTIRPLTFVVALVAGLLIALSAPADAATNQSQGPPFSTHPRRPLPRTSPAYSSYDPIVMTGSLDGCWYTHIETSRTTRGGVYLEAARNCSWAAQWRPRRYVHHDLQVRGETERRRRRGTRPLPAPNRLRQRDGRFRRRHRPSRFQGHHRRPDHLRVPGPHQSSLTGR